MKWLSGDIRSEFLKIKNTDNLAAAEACIEYAKDAYNESKKEEYEYWLALADVYCKLIIARNLDDN